jgi:hypothetical protein
METERDGSYFFVGDRFLAPTSLSGSETDDVDDAFEDAGDVEVGVGAMPPARSPNLV